jgi:hypothetical protein
MQKVNKLGLKIALICFIVIAAGICSGTEKIKITPGYVEVDGENNIYVFGQRGNRYYGSILKLDKNGNLQKALSEQLYDCRSNSKGEYSVGSGYAVYVGHPERNTFLSGKGKIIYFKDRASINRYFKYLGVKPSVENFLKWTVHPMGAMRVNGKGQICALAQGLDKARLPVLEEGKIQRRKNGEILYTNEFYEQKIAVLDPRDGHPLFVFGRSGTKEGELYMPMDIAVDSKDNIYVIDRFRHKVIKYSSEGGFIKEWGKWGANSGEFEGLHSIDIDREKGIIYVSESASAPGSDPYAVSQYRVQKFDLEGKYLGKWGGSRVTGFGLFWLAPAPIRKYDLREPKSIAVGPDDQVWLIESWRPSVSKFTPGGKLLLRFGEKGDINGDLRGKIGWDPEGIAVGGDGTVYVNDNGRRTGGDQKVRIVKYDSGGRYLGEIK